MAGGVAPLFAAPTNVLVSAGAPNAPRRLAPTTSNFLRSAASGAPRPTLLKPGSATCCAPTDAAASDNAAIADARQTRLRISPTFLTALAMVANGKHLVPVVGRCDQAVNGAAAYLRGSFAARLPAQWSRRRRRASFLL